MAHSPSEGVIRFAVEHTQAALEPRVHGEAARVLAAWREILAHLRLLGRDPSRYEGLGFGNVSARASASSQRSSSLRVQAPGGHTESRMTPADWSGATWR